MACNATDLECNKQNGSAGSLDIAHCVKNRAHCVKNRGQRCRNAECYVTDQSLML